MFVLSDIRIRPARHKETGSSGCNVRKPVKQILIGQGIDVDQIEAVSHGEKDLLILAPDNVQEPKNRRGEELVR